MKEKSIVAIIASILLLALVMNAILYQQQKALEGRVDAVESKVENLDDKIGDIENYVVEHVGDISSLDDRVSRVEARVDEALEKAGRVERKLASLTNATSELYSMYNDLLGKYRALEERVSELEQQATKPPQFPGGAGEYWGVVLRLQQWYYWFSNPLMYREFIQEVLKETPSIPEVSKIVREASVSHDEPLLEKAWKIVNYTALNLVYRRDSYVRLPTLAGGIAVWHDSLQLPNETLETYGGDCEDLALLVYAALKSVAKPGEEVYLMLAQQTPEGHVAVLAVDRNVGEAYIVDPSFGMINGYAVAVEITALNKAGKLEKRHFLAIQLMPQVKQGIFTLMKAKTVYIDLYTYVETGEKKVTDKPEIHHATPEKLLEIWETVAVLKPNKYTVATEKEVLMFPYKQLLTEWIKNRF